MEAADKKPMRNRPVCRCLVFAAVLLAGCTQIESVKDRFTPAQPQSRVVQGEARVVYDAARQTMEKMGYRLTGGGPAQGSLEGVTDIARGGSFGAAQQRSIEIRLEPAEAGATEIRVLIRETVEREGEGLSGTATDQALRDPAAYERFFQILNSLLGTGKPG